MTFEEKKAKADAIKLEYAEKKKVKPLSDTERLDRIEKLLGIYTEGSK